MSNYEICFIIVYSKKNNKYTANVLTAAVETYIRSVHVLLFNIDDGCRELQSLAQLNNKCQKIVVGATFMTVQVNEILKIVPKIKKMLPKALLIAGGPHATGDPYGTLLKLGFDLVVYGEGEATVVELLNSICNDADPRVCGTAHLDGEHLIIKLRKPVDLNLYPPFPFWRNTFNPIEIMRGCSAACYFCQVTYMFGLPRYRDIDNILYYSRIMFERGLKDLRFIAPNSFGYGSKDGMTPAPDQLTQLLYRLRILADSYGGRVFFGTFPSEVRPDSVNEDIVKEVKRFIDNKHIIIGLQSGSRKVLERIHRGHTVDGALKAVKILIDNGFRVDVDLILGFEFEDDSDIESTLQLASMLVELGARIHIHTFIPLPGTPLFSSRPKPLREDVKKFFMKLIGKGKAYGYWIEQEKMAQYVEELKSKGLVLDRNMYRDRLKIVKC